MPRAGSHQKLPILDFGKFTLRTLVAGVFAVALLFFARPSERPWLLPPGFALVALGLALRIWGTGHLVKNKVLATGGPYAHVRHPLYVGTLLIAVGLGMMAASDIVLFVLLPITLLAYFVYYAPKKERIESDRLRRRFGAEFDRYSAEVRGYVPRVLPWPHRQGRFRLAGVVANREYLIVLAVALAVAVVLVRYFWFPENG